MRAVIRRSGARADQFRCEVVVSKSVPERITGVAAQENGDLIAMYTHDRKGLASLVKKILQPGLSEGCQLKCGCLNRQSSLMLARNRFVPTLEYVPIWSRVTNGVGLLDCRAVLDNKLPPVLNSG